MREYIQNPRILGQLRSKGMVGALVVKETSLLSPHHIGHISGPVHDHGQWPRNRRARKLHHLLGEVFRGARAGRAVLDQRFSAGHIVQSGGDLLNPIF